MKNHSFSKEERIKLKKDFELIYSAGKRVRSGNRKLKALFVLKNSEISGIKIAVAVHKRAGKAFWRNRVKRLLRESYRLNKEILVSKCEENKQLLVVFSLNTINQKKFPKPQLEDVYSDVVDIMKQISKSIY
ncbi:MAG: ribonuclease P protein component [Melioribacteraceae bacterium]|nr:ribonuclease P protein component [Melioribacteraceae bacterium]